DVRMPLRSLPGTSETGGRLLRRVPGDGGRTGTHDADGSVGLEPEVLQRPPFGRLAARCDAGLELTHRSRRFLSARAHRERLEAFEGPQDLHHGVEYELH